MINQYRILAIAAICSALCAVSAVAVENTHTQKEVSALRASATAGDSDAEFQLASLYQQGDSVQQDDHEAVKWYRLAAEQNNSDAQFALGFAYRGGFGVDKSFILSYMWFDISVSRGNEDAADLRSTVAELMSYDDITEARKASKKWRAEHPLKP